MDVMSLRLVQNKRGAIYVLDSDKQFCSLDEDDQPNANAELDAKRRAPTELTPLRRVWTQDLRVPRER